MINYLVLLLVLDLELSNNIVLDQTPPTPEKLHFESKAITQTLTETFSIPNGKHLKLELSSDNNNGNFKIKI
ncbi:MAG: hypothetical protein ACK4IX_08610, partial [Candidatus Sericytochromatia bacterium]